MRKRSFITANVFVLGSFFLARAINEFSSVVLLICLAYLSFVVYIAFSLGREYAINHYNVPGIWPNVSGRNIPATEEETSALVAELAQQLAHEQDVVAALTQSLSPEQAQ